MTNRIIKFRAWDLYNKTMIDLGDLESISMRKVAGYDDDFANYELMEFTGLLDKNGKEIYEGDIVETDFDGEDGDGWTVEWDDENAGWMLANVVTPDRESFDIFDKEKEVVGNIYENKEFLEK